MTSRLALVLGAALPPQEDQSILLPFADDSTLIFAKRMRDVLRQNPGTSNVQMAWLSDENAMSYRQLAQLLPEGPDLVIRNSELQSILVSGKYKAILISRVFRTLGDALKKRLVKYKRGRTCVIAFFGGLDFFPETGFERRRHCDGAFVFPRSDIPRFARQQDSFDVGWQEIGFGHPSFLRPAGPPPDLADRRDIYFFTQALSPSTRRGRLHMLQAMAAIARANPDRTVWIKLRHLPDENHKHLHREQYDYPGLMADLGDVPANLKLSADDMETALSQAALGITCTSTAAADVVRAGVPCMVHLDFVDAYRDPLVSPMRTLFDGSGLITGLEDMLNLRASAPNPEWVNNMFCTPDLAQDILDVVARFHERPFQIK